MVLLMPTYGTNYPPCIKLCSHSANKHQAQRDATLYLLEGYGVRRLLGQGVPISDSELYSYFLAP